MVRENREYQREGKMKKEIEREGTGDRVSENWREHNEGCEGE
jgi:hypothetical protein